MIVIFFSSEESAMSLGSFSRGKADLGRSAANSRNLIGCGGDKAEGRCRGRKCNDKKRGGYLRFMADNRFVRILLCTSSQQFHKDFGSQQNSAKGWVVLFGNI